jgi:hypothetical protein
MPENKEAEFSPVSETGKLLLEMESARIYATVNISGENDNISLEVDNVISIKKSLSKENLSIFFKFFYDTEKIISLLGSELMGSNVTVDLFAGSSGSSANLEGLIVDVEIKNMTSKESVVILTFVSQAN